MPTSTFFNLPEQKREGIMAAARQELSMYPLEKASVNRIIQKAGIPRGSFYQYFEDRDDFLAYVVNIYRRQMIERVADELKSNGGDPFAALDAALLWVRSRLSGETLAVCRSIYMGVSLSDAYDIRRRNCEHGEEELSRLMELADVSRLALSESELGDAIKLVAVVFRSALADLHIRIDEADSVIAEYRRKIRLLQDGIMKGEHNAR